MPNDATSVLRVEAAGGRTTAFEAALAEARNAPAGAATVIRLASGDYYLDQPIELDQRDSGLTIEAEKPGTVTLIGGRRVTGWQPDGKDFWAAYLPGVAEGNWDFRMLLVSGRVAPRARLPETGTFEHASRFDVRWMSTTGGGWERKPTLEELTTMRYRPQDIGPWLDPHNARNAEVTVYHMWDESLVGLKSADYKTKTMVFSNPAGHPPGAFGVKKYALWNVRQGMTRPGQWYLDRVRGKLVYWPLPGEDMDEAVIIAPTVQTLVALRGKEGSPVKGVTLRGLTLTVATTPLISGGFGASALPAAVEVQHAEDCTLQSLQVRQVGGYGIKTRNTTRLRVSRCEVHSVGAGGIVAHAAKQAVLADNRVHHVGVDYPSGIGLWMNGEGCTAEHNAVHDTSYTAIAASGSDHVIAANRIHHPMQVLRDGAAIYITFCKRITLRGNFVSDVAEVSPGYGASAYYLDEQAEDCVVEGNLAMNVTTPSHNHMAQNNTLGGNVFISDGALRLAFARCKDFTLEANVIVSGGELRVRGPEAVTKWQGNTLYSAAGPAVAELLTDYQVRQERPLELPAGNDMDNPELVVAGGRVSPTASGTSKGVLDVSSAGPR